MPDSNGIFIKTCNRLEFYYGDGVIPIDVARHLFQMVSGLESSMIGEIAVQGQVKNSYKQACERYALSKSLHMLFQTALSVGKRVRNESSISKGAVSHSNAAVDLICKSGLAIEKSQITIIGANKINEDIIRFLKSKGAETILLGNRTYDKASQIALRNGCHTFRLENLSGFLSFTDILISSTSAPHFIVPKSIFPSEKKMLILDMAFPRDVDPEIGFMENVRLYNIESIEKYVMQNIGKRKKEIEKARSVIERELEIFYKKINRHVAHQNA
jgi:glutamyl-tRNA reductase